MATQRIHLASGVTLSYEDQGAGQTLLFVHGFPLDHSLWTEQLRFFSRRYRCLAPDLRGFGGSTVTRGEVSMVAFAADLAEFLQGLGVCQSVTLCGLSMGGYVAWEFLAHHRSMVRRLVMCNTKAAADSADIVRGRQLMAADVLRLGTSVAVERILPKLFSPSTEPDRIQSWADRILRGDAAGVAAAQLGMASRRDMTDSLGSIDVPVLVVAGEHDAITPPREMKQMAQRIPSSRFNVVAAAGHLTPWEQPDPFNQILDDFLSATDG